MSPNPLKVCITSSSSFPTPGGVEMRISRYLKGFTERGVEVEVIAGTPALAKLTEHDTTADWRSFPLGHVFPPEFLDNVPIHRIRLGDKMNKERIHFLGEQIIKLLDSGFVNPHIFHSLSTKPNFTIPLLKALKARGKGLVFSYAIAHNAPIWPPKKLISGLAKRYFLRQAYNQFDTIIVATDALKGLLRSLGVTSQIAVIPNGVNIEIYRPAGTPAEKVSLRKELGLPPDCQLVCGVGTVYPRKGCDILLEAWHRLSEKYPNLHVVWLGRRRDLFVPELADYRKRMDELLTRGDAPARIHMIGHSDRVSSYLRAADIFAFPSEREGMPNAVLEAMASGLPTVMTYYRGYSEEIGRNHHEYIMTERNSERLAASLELLLSSEELRRNLGNNAVSFIRKTMPLSRSIDRHVDVYRAVAEKTHYPQ